MSDMKCPKCGGRLVYWGATGALLKCSQCNFGWGNEELWQELIRTRKAFADTKKKLDDLQKDYDLAIQHAKTMTETCLEYKAKLDIAIGGITYMRNNCFDYAADYMDYADGILEQIKDFEYRGMSTGLKDKIEFPEYNDNLLEEFDKQFFENGQDDDLTETALEQKDK